MSYLAIVFYRNPSARGYKSLIERKSKELVKILEDTRRYKKDDDTLIEQSVCNNTMEVIVITKIFKGLTKKEITALVKDIFSIQLP